MTPFRIWCNPLFTADHAARFEADVAPHTVVWASDQSRSNLHPAGTDPALVRECQVAFGQPNVDDVLASTSLQLVHLTSAGYTRYDRDDLRARCQSRGMALCNASAVYADPCAQHVLAMMLAVCRNLPAALDSQRATRGWPYHALRGGSVLLGPRSRVLIVGYGAIGRRLVELLAPYGVQVRGFRRTVKGDENCPTSPIAELDAHLPEADHVVNILPASPETAKFFDAARLAKVRRGAAFYNIGRGDTVDQPALIGALTDGHLAHAYLDVMTPEPLPPEHPLWTTPHCYITPHTAGGTDDEQHRQSDHFLANLRRFERGEPLLDRVM